MSESTDAAAGGRRGGRTVSKSTPDEVMELACGLPLTRSVLRSVVAGATPGQLGVLADLFRAENASRTESRRARLIRNAGFPCVKGFDGYDWGMASFPADWGREQLMDLGFVDRAEDLVLYGDVGCGKTHMAIATGMLACERGMPVRFFTASSLVMRLRRARDENRLDAELRAIGRARLLVIDELGYLPIDIDGARLLFQVVADSYEKRSVVFHHEPGVRTVGRGVRRRRHGRRGHRPHRAPRKDRQVPWRVIPQQPLPDEINEKSGTNPAAGDGVHFERRWCSD